MRRIRITAGSVSAEAELKDTVTADAIWSVLPITAEANTWGDEVTFSIPLRLKAEAPQEVVEPGDLGYWPPARLSVSSSAELWPV